ncbi:MAG TPA: hypothetical protein VI566_13285 [Xanthomonadales bacterium]|nr:hypothetical protein [Xanthomonadales bacterium]
MKARPRAWRTDPAIHVPFMTRAYDGSDQDGIGPVYAGTPRGDGLMNMHSYAFGFFLLVILQAAGFAARADEAPGSSEQRAACDARCREDYQNNASALQACLRNCGAIGPASPCGAIAPVHEATHTAQQAGAGAGPAAAATINTTRSNTFRNQAGTGDATPVQATTVKGSKSNSDNRQASPAVPPAPVESANLNLSKSNINASPPEGEGTTEDSDGDR